MSTSRRDFLKTIGGLAVGGSLLARARASRGNGGPRVRYAKVKAVGDDGAVELAPCSADGVDQPSYRYAMHRVGPWWECTYDRQGQLKSIEPIPKPRRSEELAPQVHPGGDVTFIKTGWQM